MPTSTARGTALCIALAVAYLVGLIVYVVVVSRPAKVRKSQPATSQPATSRPATSQPATSQPATSQQSIADDVVRLAAEPATTQLTCSTPVATLTCPGADEPTNLCYQCKHRCEAFFAAGTQGLQCCYAVCNATNSLTLADGAIRVNGGHLGIFKINYAPIMYTYTPSGSTTPVVKDAYQTLLDMLDQSSAGSTPSADAMMLASSPSASTYIAVGAIAGAALSMATIMGIGKRANSTLTIGTEADEVAAYTKALDEFVAKEMARLSANAAEESIEIYEQVLSLNTSKDVDATMEAVAEAIGDLDDLGGELWATTAPTATATATATPMLKAGQLFSMSVLIDKAAMPICLDVATPSASAAANKWCVFTPAMPQPYMDNHGNFEVCLIDAKHHPTGFQGDTTALLAIGGPHLASAFATNGTFVYLWAARRYFEIDANGRLVLGVVGAAPTTSFIFQRASDKLPMLPTATASAVYDLHALAGVSGPNTAVCCSSEISTQAGYGSVDVALGPASTPTQVVVVLNRASMLPNGNGINTNNVTGPVQGVWPAAIPWSVGPCNTRAMYYTKRSSTEHYPSGVTSERQFMANQVQLQIYKQNKTLIHTLDADTIRELSFSWFTMSYQSNQCLLGALPSSDGGALHRLAFSTPSSGATPVPGAGTATGIAPGFVWTICGVVPLSSGTGVGLWLCPGKVGRVTIRTPRLPGVANPTTIGVVDNVPRGHITELADAMKPWLWVFQSAN